MSVSEITTCDQCGVEISMKRREWYKVVQYGSGLAPIIAHPLDLCSKGCLALWAENT